MKDLKVENNEDNHLPIEKQPASTNFLPVPSWVPCKPAPVVSKIILNARASIDCIHEVLLGFLNYCTNLRIQVDVA